MLLGDSFLYLPLILHPVYFVLFRSLKDCLDAVRTCSLGSFSKEHVPFPGKIFLGVTIRPFFRTRRCLKSEILEFSTLVEKRILVGSDDRKKGMVQLL